MLKHVGDIQSVEQQIGAVSAAAVSAKTSKQQHDDNAGFYMEKGLSQDQSLSAESGATLDISQEARALYEQQNNKTLQDLEFYKQQMEAAEAAGDQVKDLAKLMEIARRISNGDHVPGTDEKKLMDYSSELYQAAKAAALLRKNMHPKDYDTMYPDEDEQEQEDSGIEAVDSAAVDSTASDAGTEASATSEAVEVTVS